MVRCQYLPDRVATVAPYEDSDFWTAEPSHTLKDNPEGCHTTAAVGGSKIRMLGTTRVIKSIGRQNGHRWE